jgi:hypothetical protein
VTPGDTITSGTQDTKAAYLRDRLTNALDALAPLFDADCTRKKALACWDKVYDTDFFSLRSSEDSRSSAAFIPAVALGTMAALESATSAAVLGSSSGRHA